MKSVISIGALIFCLTLGFTVNGYSHCEIPCGIYGDSTRIDLIQEHVKTILVSMEHISKLSKKINHPPLENNQLVRWIINKEEHANKIQHIVSQYFMTQRIKSDQKHYAQTLPLLHQILIQAMKCKQTTDPKHAEEISTLIKKFWKLYQQK